MRKFEKKSQDNVTLSNVDIFFKKYLGTLKGHSRFYNTPIFPESNSSTIKKEFLKPDVLDDIFDFSELDIKNTVQKEDELL